jgi:ATP-dependent exoDNAse (exonuclease V) alpha subunit
MFWLLRLELEDGAVVADDLQGRDRQQLSHPLSRVRRIDEIEIAHIARDEIRHQALVEPVRIDIELQKALNPPGEIRIDRFGWTFCPGDKVMQVENDYDKDVYNGDLGVVSRIDTEESELAVDFEGREVTYGFGELDELVLAYATTIHKSQGSEYPAVVIPLTTQHYPMLQRNLVYTGVTRGKRLVVLVGQRKALAIAVKGVRTRRRWSKLGEWLIGVDTPRTKRAVS